MSPHELRALVYSLIIREMISQFDAPDLRRKPVIKIMDALKRKHAFYRATRAEPMREAGRVAVEGLQSVRQHLRLYVPVLVARLYRQNETVLTRYFKLNPKHFDAMYAMAYGSADFREAYELSSHEAAEVLAEHIDRSIQASCGEAGNLPGAASRFSMLAAAVRATHEGGHHAGA